MKFYFPEQLKSPQMIAFSLINYSCNFHTFIHSRTLYMTSLCDSCTMDKYMMDQLKVILQWEKMQRKEDRLIRRQEKKANKQAQELLEEKHQQEKQKAHELTKQAKKQASAHASLMAEMYDSKISPEAKLESVLDMLIAVMSQQEEKPEFLKEMQQHKADPSEIMEIDLIELICKIQAMTEGGQHLPQGKFNQLTEVMRQLQKIKDRRQQRFSGCCGY